MLTTPDVAIATHALGKTYANGVTALADVDLRVGYGEIFALLGRNGAGKSTTVRLLTTLSRPSVGTAVVAGFDVARQPRRVVSRIGVTMQDAALDPTMTAREHVLLLARLWGHRATSAASLAAAVLDEFGLAHAADRAMGTLSGGMRRRADIAGVVLTRPSVLFLDEPTTGLDAQSRRALWQRVRAMRDDGVAVLLTTQYLEEAEALADHVAILHDGRVAASGTPDELRSGVGGVQLRARPNGRHAVAVDDTGWITRPYPRAVDALAFVDDLRARGVELAAVSLTAPTLEDVYLEVTGAHLDAAPPAPPTDSNSTT